VVPELCGGAPAGAVDRYGLRALVRQAAGRLAAAGVTSPQVDARILAEHLLGRALLLADGADGDFPAAYDALVLRRECREPLQHIIGRMWLRGAELISRPGVFIVRPETEVVAGAAIEAARKVMDGGGGVVLTADLCTGSGAIAACVAKEVPAARVVAVEISETAASLARENCERLVPGRVEVIHADATDPLVLHDLNGQVDVVVSNPPYVPAGAVELEELIGRRCEDLGHLPLTIEAGTVRPEPALLEGAPVPRRLTEIRNADLRLHVGVDAVRWLGPRTLEVRGCAWVWGLDPGMIDRPTVEVVDETGRVRGRAQADRCEAPRADLEASDPCRSYLTSGIVVRLQVEAGRPSWFRVVTRVAGREVRAWMPQPAGSSRRHLAPPETGQHLEARGQRGLLQVAPAPSGIRGSEARPGGEIDVVLLCARLDTDATLELSGTVAPAPDGLDIVLCGRAAEARAMTVPAVLAPGGGWSASIDLADPDVELATYPLSWSTVSQDEPGNRIKGACLAGEGIDGPATEVPIAAAPTSCAAEPDSDVTGADAGRPARRARILTRTDGSVAVAVIPPLTPGERSRRGHRLLIEREAGPLRPGVFLESFGGRSAGDNPAAICEDLAAHGVGAPLWWSVVDGTVRVPAGARPVVVGSPQWVEALRTSRVIVTNDHLPSWFSKREGQHLLQTWHGTPIKKLLHDAPRAVTLRYRRLMDRQVPQWDLLLAQSPQAGRRLQQALGYRGPVRVGEYPRNVRLLGGAEVRRRVRHELGIAPGQPVILYAPTWRESLRPSTGAAGCAAAHGPGPVGALDGPRLAELLDAVVLMRSHHMNRAGCVPGMIDVSGYPSVEELMLAADILVSDYSSIFFDFALTGKPAVVYTPDLASYRDVERGLYGDWPLGSGLPVAADHDELASHLQRLLGDIDVAEGCHSPLEVEPVPILDNLTWIRGWIARFLS